MPMFSCMLECAKGANIPLIADGGVKLTEMLQSINAADMVMIGGMFAECVDSPGKHYKNLTRDSLRTNHIVKANILLSIKMFAINDITEVQVNTTKVKQKTLKEYYEKFLVMNSLTQKS